ncbi:MAG TPA: hypothetical protein VFX12_09500 [Vicinamibacterales bacterium]|nr:hypothetical protein [Vicinamibacterales bacterium]
MRDLRARVAGIVVIFGVIGTAGLAYAQTEATAQPARHGKRLSELPTFLGGAATALAAHEAGHVLFDGLFGVKPELRRVSFHGIPFFAISHRAGLPWRQEFVIDSAGFWVQHAGSEAILTRHPSLRDERAPFLKGVLAFNVLASIAYAGAGFARTGPEERDTRGMADARRWKEPAIAALILAPALLDAYRYYHPGQRWAVWTSRGVKVGMVALVF